MRRRRPYVVSILIPLIIGVVGLNTVMQRPRFAAYQAVDVVQLLGSGLCFGVALAAFAFWLKNRNPGARGQ